MKPPMPDLTQAHILAVLIVVLGAVSKVLEAFGVYHLSEEQNQALTSALAALVTIGGLVVAADAYLRGKRNDHVARVTVAKALSAEPDLPTNPIAEAIVAEPAPVRKPRTRRPKAPPAP